MLNQFDTNLFGKDYVWYVEDGVWKLRLKVWTEYIDENNS